MRRLRILGAAGFLLALLLLPVSAGWFPLVTSGGGGGCSQSTTFLARTSGLSGTETTAYTNMICGLVTDSIITGTMNGANSGAGACGSVLDALYVLATNNKTTAFLNLCGTSYGLTETVTVTCTVDVGCAGNGTTGFLNTGFNPSTATTPNFAQNSASLGVYIQNNRTTNAADVAIGASDAGGSVYAYIQPLQVTYQYDMNAGNFPSAANTSTRGAWAQTRTAVSTLAVYKNNATTLTTSSGTSSAVVSQNLFILALNGSGGAGSLSADQISFAFIGAGLTSTQAFNINTRLNQFMVDLGGGNNVF